METHHVTPPRGARRFWGLALFTVGLTGAPAAVADQGPVAVLWRAPACGHQKLGSIAVAEGTAVSSRTKQAWVPPASYERAFEKLGDAAAARGGNAVVLRMHEATFFTSGKTRSRRPVLVQLRGAAIALPASGCELDPVDPQLILDRALKGEPFEVPPEPTAADAASS